MGKIISQREVTANTRWREKGAFITNTSVPVKFFFLLQTIRCLLDVLSSELPQGPIFFVTYLVVRGCILLVIHPSAVALLLETCWNIYPSFIETSTLVLGKHLPQFYGNIYPSFMETLVKKVYIMLPRIRARIEIIDNFEMLLEQPLTCFPIPSYPKKESFSSIKINRNIHVLCTMRGSQSAHL